MIEMHKTKLSDTSWVYIVGKAGNWHIYWGSVEYDDVEDVIDLGVSLSKKFKSLAKCEAFCQEMFGESEPE